MNEHESEYLTISFPLSCFIRVVRGFPKDLGERDNCLTFDVLVMEYSPHPTYLICKEGITGATFYVSVIVNESICVVSGDT